MQESRLQYLFNNYLSGSITSSEKEEMMQLVAQSENDELIRLFIDKVIDETGEEMDISDATANTIINAIIHSEQRNESVAPVHRVHFLKTSWFRYAAAVVLLVGGAVWYKMLNQVQHDGKVRNDGAVVQNDVQPGSNKAVLTVGGKKIDLSSAKTGIAVGATVTYTDGGEILNLVQNDGSGGAQDDGALGGVRQMELKTPRGGQYQALLPDGSKIWLNAASSIQFPSRFDGNTREVQIEGEVYLEIAKNTKKPFIIKSNKTLVEVLGTSLNVNTYQDEEVERITLIDGSIRVNNTILKPDQQATVTNNLKLTIQTVDAEAAIAWKNGFFNLQDVGLKDIMKQLERWYDINVQYQGKIPDLYFEGKMDRALSLSQALKLLKETGVSFRLEGKTLIIQ